MPPNYAYATLADAQNSLASRLDQSFTQWPRAELTLYIQEALRTFNALTSFWRVEFDFDLAQGSQWYDITDTTVAPNTVRPITVTDNQLLQLIEYHLLEPQTAAYPLAWAGSQQFSIPQILGALTRRQNEVLSVTGCTVTRQLVSAPIVRTGTILPDTTIDIRRVCWMPTVGQGYSNTILAQSDAFSKRAFDYNYTTKSEQPPLTWLQSTQPPPRFDVDYVPPVPGNYEVMTVNAGNVFNSTKAQLLSIPDDWSWLPKWGALGDLLSSEANSRDSPRAEYCYRRYQDGLKLLSNSPAMLAMQLNGIPMSIDGVANGDTFNNGWQAAAQAQPQSAYTTGLNMLGFPAPDAGPYSVLLTVVQNAPIPTASGDFIQVARGDYDSILDMAQHLAMFKIPGAAFQETIPLYAKFLERATVYQKKLKEMGALEWAAYDISRTDEQRNPRMDGEEKQ